MLMELEYIKTDGSNMWAGVGQGESLPIRIFTELVQVISIFKSMKIMFLSGNSEENDSMSTPFPSMEYQSAPPGLTQEVKVVYDSNVFAEYLRNEGILSGEIYNVENNQVKIEFTFDDVKYAIT